MPELSLISSFLPDSTNPVVKDAKFITSVIVGAVAAAAAVVRNLSDIRQDRSKRSIEKLETAKIAELLDLLAKVPSGDSFSACEKELELQLAQSLRTLDALRTKVAMRAQAPNHDLTLAERLFILFAPRAPRAWIIHGLAYLFMAVGPLAVLMLVLLRSDAGTVGDVMVLIVFGGLAFRAWALAERKWAITSVRPAQFEPHPLTAVFVLRKSIGWKMLAAQVCMWTCLFCAVESLEDIFLAGIEANGEATHLDPARPEGNPTPTREAGEGLLLFLTSLLGASICRAWAWTEWKNGSTTAGTTFLKAIFPMPKPETPMACLLAASYGAAIAFLILSVVCWSLSLSFNDLIDRIEFSFVWLAACVACNRLLNFHVCMADSSMEDKSTALSQSIAA